MFRVGDKVLNAYNMVKSEQSDVRLRLYNLGEVTELFPKVQRMSIKFYDMMEYKGRDSYQTIMNYHDVINLTTVPARVVREIIEYFEDIDRTLLTALHWVPKRDIMNIELSRWNPPGYRDRLMKIRSDFYTTWELNQEQNETLKHELYRNRHNTIMMANSEYGQDRSVNGIDEAIIALYFVIAQMPDQDIHQKNRREQIRLSIKARLKEPSLEVKFHKLMTEIRTEYEVVMEDKDTRDEYKFRYNPQYDEEGSEEVDKTKKRKSDREVTTDLTDFRREMSSLPSIPPTSNNEQQRIHELELTVNRLKGKSRTLEGKVKILEDQLRADHHEWMGERADFLEALEIERVKLTTSL
jgi:hypothetical protein